MKDIWVETFKEIAGYEGLYGISTLGRVVNIRTGRFLKPFSNGHGYYQVGLCKNGISTKYYVHRLVLNTFEPNDDPKMEIDHRNGNRGDNRLVNLQWLTHAENMTKIGHEEEV